MRVAFVTSLERGGPIEHTLTLARYLVRAGVTVDAVAATEAVASRFAEHGVNATVLPLRRPLDPSAARRIQRFVHSADVVHAQDRRSGLWARAWPRRPRRVIVYTAHGLPDPFLPPPAGRRPVGLRATLAYRGLDRALARRADAIVVATHAAAELFARELGYPRTRLIVVPHGIPPAQTGPRRGSLVGTIAHFEPVKALDVFLRAAAEVEKQHPSVVFGMFGTGPGVADMRALRDSLGLRDRVEMPGHVPAPEALARLSIFVSSSLMETSGLAVLEAMAAGVPVVATRVGGVTENAPPGTAELVEPGDAGALASAIARLLEDPARADRQARAARDRVGRAHDPDDSARAMLRLYERLLGVRRRA